jgi:leucyl-tRNA synthetase
MAHNSNVNNQHEDHVLSEKIHADFYGKTRVDERAKYFVTFPYPYVNGRLHLGHAFTMKKVDVIARVKRLAGFNVLFPFGFHGTGTPIVACADKVRKELDMYTDGAILDNTSQLGILEMMGVSREDFPKFIDPNYWLEYFQIVAKQDLKKFGISADLERSFITTSLNPHYDSFIKWQFEKLNKMLEFGKRYMIYDSSSKQPCSDHDRSIGEGVEPQEYSLIKLKLDDITLLAGTLRPETLYGQTNIWVNKDGVYSMFSVGDDRCVARYETFLNLSHQRSDITLINKEYIRGSDLIGKTVNAPFVGDIKILHMEGVSMKRGTGIVTSVPTDSPTDYLYWKKYLGVPELTGIIQVGSSTTYAVDQVEKARITINDVKKLEEIHNNVYMTENKEGVLLVGKYAGLSLSEAREHIKQDLLESNDIITYYEPQTEVVSRSGVECVVALTDQWYINYGDATHTKKVNDYIDNVLEMNDDTKKHIREASDWINKWPVSRLATHCLGTVLPVDKKFMIDSLSDSTIYFAYYTVCNTVTDIPAEMMTFDAWEYIFSDGDLPTDMIQFEDQFVKMRTEFNYWYPMDLRISGRDLITNHLIMALYNHSFVWPDRDMMPRAYYTNAHLMINDKKMSKSTGNFMTLSDAIDKYGADAVHIALAKAGDGISNANFDATEARNAIVFLNTEFTWIKDTLCKMEDDKTDPTYDVTSEPIWLDNVFINDMNNIINRFCVSINRLSISRAFQCVYNMVNIREDYKKINNNTGIFSSRYRKVYYDNIKLYMKNFVTMLSVFCPFWIERLRSAVDIDTIFGKLEWFKTEAINTTFCKESWIKTSMFDFVEMAATKYKKLVQTKKKEYTMKITVYSRYDDYIVQIVNTMMENISGEINGEIVKKYFENLSKMCTDNKKKQKIGIFSKECVVNTDRFGRDWAKWVTCGDNYEYDMITTWLPKLVDVCKIEIESCIVSNNNKTGPGYPSLVFI